MFAHSQVSYRSYSQVSKSLGSRRQKGTRFSEGLWSYTNVLLRVKEESVGQAQFTFHDVFWGICRETPTLFTSVRGQMSDQRKDSSQI